MSEVNLKINKRSSVTIQQQLIQQISNAIASNEFEQGDSLPSINELSKKLKISRDSVFKAYRELKQMNIVGSTPAKGYYVTQQYKKVLLLLDFFSPFKELLHNSFKQNLPAEYSIDVVFHHYNNRMFKNIIQQNTGLYDAYVVMNIDTENFIIHSSLKKIDPAKVIFLDIPVSDWKGFNKEKYAGVFQEFDKAVYNELQEIKDIILKYKSFSLINTGSLNHPGVTIEYFTRFCYDNDIMCNIYTDVKDVKPEKGDAFLVLRQSDLSILLQHIKRNNYKMGSDIGVLAYNDSPLYEYIDKGISVISTNFEEMGNIAAEMLINKTRELVSIKTKIKLRGSI